MGLCNSQALFLTSFGGIDRIYAMNQLNRWQRIAIVASVAWFGAWAYYFGQGFPTEESVRTEIDSWRYAEQGEADRERDEALRQCKTETGGDWREDLYSGCSKHAYESHARAVRSIKNLSSRQSEADLEKLPRDQLAHLLKLIAIGAVFPLLVYGAISWIARAPKDKAGQ